MFRKRDLICLLSFTCNNVVSVRRGFLHIHRRGVRRGFLYINIIQLIQKDESLENWKFLRRCDSLWLPIIPAVKRIHKQLPTLKKYFLQFIRAKEKRSSNIQKFKSINETEARWPSGRASDSGARGRGFDPHSGRRVVSLSKIHLLPKSTVINTQEAPAPSRYD